MKNVRTPRLSLLTALSSALIAFGLSGCTSTSETPGQADFSPFQAPAWELKAMDGKMVKSSDFTGKVMILDFWATWCGPCVQEIPGFVELQERYEKDGLVIVGVNIGETPDEVLPFMKKLGMNYPVVSSTDEFEAALGGIPAIPATFIVNREGTIVNKHVGFTSAQVFETALQSLL